MTRRRALVPFGSVIAYFSMEIALDSAMPTYSGGLGALAADNLRAAADLGLAMVGVTLLYHKGYFRQHLDEKGNQTESPVVWSPVDFLQSLSPRVTVMIEGRKVQLQSWRYVVHGVSGEDVYVYFLDADLPENSPFDRTLTDYLYGGDSRYRLCQEALLGLGGVSMLRALGYGNVQAYHMNEGHSALLALALLDEVTQGRGVRNATKADFEAVRQRCVFTTHTPVPAAQDKFPRDLVRQVLGDDLITALQSEECFLTGVLNMTHLALVSSRYINGVSMRHEEISQGMFPGYPINSITNGVHAVTWTATHFQHLYDRYIPEWRHDNLYLRYAISIPLGEIRQAHIQTKQELLAEVRRRTGSDLDVTVMTVGIARRATAYKRANLLFSDLNRLRRIAKEVGPIQVVCAGKAHPRDESGKAIIRSIFAAAASLKDIIPVVFLEEYGLALAKYMASGCDVWLNTPQKPHEASGTSGMKAALNGVPSLSVLDGWWIEGNVEGVTGWSIGDSWESESNPEREIESLYDKLEYLILPLYYHRPDEFARMMRSAVALNGSYYNAERMVFQYLEHAYYPEERLEFKPVTL